MRALLDTSALLGPVPERLAEDLAISAATLAELHFGVLVARDDVVRAERLRRLGVVERTFQALPIDAGVARDYGALAAAVVSKGRQPRARTADLLIAATAVAHDARLYTRNGDDFAGLHGLVDVIALA